MVLSGVPSVVEIMGWLQFSQVFAGWSGDECVDAGEQCECGVVVGLLDVGWCEELFGLPASLEGFFDVLGAARPQRARGELFGRGLADHCGKPIEPVGLVLGGVACGDEALDAPPQRGCCVIVWDRSGGRGLVEEAGCVVAGAG